MIIVRAFTLLAELVFLVSGVVGCGSGSSAQVLLERGVALAFRSFVSAQGLELHPNVPNVKFDGTTFAPGISFGTALLPDQTKLDAYWIHPGLTRLTKPTGDFATKSYVAYASSLDQISNGQPRIRRVSQSQIIISVCHPEGVAFAAEVRSNLIVLEIDAQLTIAPTVEIETVKC